MFFRGPTAACEPCLWVWRGVVVMEVLHQTVPSKESCNMLRQIVIYCRYCARVQLSTQVVFKPLLKTPSISEWLQQQSSLHTRRDTLPLWSPSHCLHNKATTLARWSFTKGRPPLPDSFTKSILLYHNMGFLSTPFDLCVLQLSWSCLKYTVLHEKWYMHLVLIIIFIAFTLTKIFQFTKIDSFQRHGKV